MYKVLRKQFVLLLSFLYLAFALPFCKTNADEGETKKPKVSVIMPVYATSPNSDQFLRECLDSVLNNTFEDIELICVDDASPKVVQGKEVDLGKILDEYAEKNKERMKVIHKSENGGISEARNDGMKLARGEYITFCDDDDIVHPRAYEFAYKYAKNDDVDLLQFNSKSFEDKKKIKFEQNNFSDGSIVSLENFKYSGNVWKKFFKLDLINKLQLKFIKRGIFEEDLAFIASYLPNATKIKVIQGTFYYYRSHECNTFKTENKSWVQESFIKLLRYILEKCKYSKIKDDKVKILSMLMHSRFVRCSYPYNAKKVLKALGKDLYNKKVIKKCPRDVQQLIKKFEKKARVKKSLVN